MGFLGNMIKKYLKDTELTCNELKPVPTNDEEYKYELEGKGCKVRIGNTTLDVDDIRARGNLDTSEL